VSPLIQGLRYRAACDESRGPCLVALVGSSIYAEINDSGCHRLDANADQIEDKPSAKRDAAFVWKIPERMFTV